MVSGLIAISEGTLAAGKDESLANPRRDQCSSE